MYLARTIGDCRRARTLEDVAAATTWTPRLPSTEHKRASLVIISASTLPSPVVWCHLLVSFWGMVVVPATKTMLSRSVSILHQPQHIHIDIFHNFIPYAEAKKALTAQTTIKYKSVFMVKTNQMRHVVLLLKINGHVVTVKEGMENQERARNI
jgi:hypothetical protein